MTNRSVGRSVAPALAGDKVTGRGRFPPDFLDEAVLHVAVRRAESPHARITRLDLEPARAVPGVGVVLGRQELGFDDVLRHVGDTVAAVAAESEEAAEQAAAAIRVELERLEPRTDPIEVARSTERGGDGLALEVEHDQGDVEAGLAEAAVVLEGEYATGRPTHCNLSPRACVARLTPDGVVEVMSSLDAPFFSQRELAEALGLPADRVRVVLPELASSSFGGRSGVNIHCEPIAARLAMEADGRPVRLVYDPAEEFVAGTTRHAVQARLTAGADADGRLHTLDLELVADHGPYDNYVNRIVLGAGRDRPLDLLDLAHYRYRGRAVLTNNLMGGEMRGIGATQICHILGMHMDEMARRLGMDQVAFYLKNLPEGARSGGGLARCLESGAEAFGWPGGGRPTQPGLRRGVGVAIGTHTTGLGTFHGSDNASARVRLDASGGVTVETAAPDSGQGSTTIASQIVEEELGVAAGTIRFRRIDTSSAPPDPWGSVASRGTYVVAAAVRLAAAEARVALCSLLAGAWGVAAEDIRCEGGRARHVPSGRDESLAGALAGIGEVVGEAKAVTDDTPPTYGAYFADVDVDPDTGLVRVRHFVAALDVGFAINPEHCRGQIEGALAQGLEFALGAEVVMPGGMPENTSLVDYRVARADDMPTIDVILVEEAEEGGPYGARGIGTPALTPVMPAIVNAVRDAIGHRPARVPIRPETLLDLIGVS